jgi:hypothetical protein
MVTQEEPPLPRAPTIPYPHVFEADLDSNQDDNDDARAVVVEPEANPPERVTQVRQARVPPHPQRAPFSYASVARGVRSKSIQAMHETSYLTLAQIFPCRSRKARSHLRHCRMSNLIRVPCGVNSQGESKSLPLARTMLSLSLTQSIRPRERLRQDHRRLPRRSAGPNSRIPRFPKAVWDAGLKAL